jgi:hypothetical protein
VARCIRSTCHVLNALSTGSMENLTHLCPRRRSGYTLGSCFDRQVVGPLVAHSDFVFHLSARGHRVESLIWQKNEPTSPTMSVLAGRSHCLPPFCLRNGAQGSDCASYSSFDPFARKQFGRVPIEPLNQRPAIGVSELVRDVLGGQLVIVEEPGPAGSAAARRSPSRDVRIGSERGASSSAGSGR